LNTPLNGYFNTLQYLRRLGTGLVLVHSNNAGSNGYFIMPGGRRVAKTTAEAIIGGPDVQPHDRGLFPDQAQSWRLLLW
jgi:hypothetical protein